MANEQDGVTPEQVAEVEKRLTADFEKRLNAEIELRKAAEKTATDNATAIAKIREESRTREFIAKAQVTPEWGKGDEFGPVLAKIEAALTADEFKAFDAKRLAIHKQLEQSALLTELGVQGETDAASPEAKLDMLAKARMKDHDETYAAAYAAVCKTADGSVLLSQSLRKEK